MDKRSVYAIVFFVLISISSIIQFSHLASAQAFGIDFRQGADQLIRWVQDATIPFFEVLLGVNEFDVNFFATVLLLILFVVVINAVLKKAKFLGKNSAVNFIVALIVSILSVRFMPDDLVNAALVPYGTLGVAIAVLIPFLIYFYFVHTSINSRAGRKCAWIAFAVIFFGLWIERWVKGEAGTFNWIYLAGIVAVGITFIFDRKIHEYFGLSDMKKANREIIRRQIADIDADLARYANIVEPAEDTREYIKNLEARRRELTKKLHGF
jgi:hypothetical protein